MLLWPAWANVSAYTSYINGWKSWRNKKIGRTRTDWTLAKVQCQWRKEFGIHEHFWKLKGRVTYQKSANAWEMPLSAWEREIALKCVRLESSAKSWSDLKVTHIPPHCMYSSTDALLAEKTSVKTSFDRNRSSCIVLGQGWEWKPQKRS